MAWQPQQGHYDSPYSNATPDPPPPPMNGLNGFTDHKDHNLDDDAFGASGGIVSAFDAFRKAHPVVVPLLAPHCRQKQKNITPG